MSAPTGPSWEKKLGCVRRSDFSDDLLMAFEMEARIGLRRDCTRIVRRACDEMLFKFPHMYSSAFHTQRLLLRVFGHTPDRDCYRNTTSLARF